jgi:hypothetical protein
MTRTVLQGCVGLCHLEHLVSFIWNDRVTRFDLLV